MHLQEVMRVFHKSVALVSDNFYACLSTFSICQNLNDLLWNKHVANQWTISASMQAQWRCKLMPYSQKAHLNYPMVGSFLGHSVSSQWTHKKSSHRELWAFCEFATLTVSLLWAIREIIPMNSPCSGSSELTVWVANSRKAHSKLTVVLSCEYIMS